MGAAKLMATLPASWNLKVKKNKGKAEVWGTSDSGEAYCVRKCKDAEVSESDVRDIAHLDRERTTSREAVDYLLADGRKAKHENEVADFDAWVEAAGPVVRAGLGNPTLGYSPKYAANYDKVFKGD